MSDLEYSAQKDMMAQTMARQALPYAIKRLRGRALEGERTETDPRDRKVIKVDRQTCIDLMAIRDWPRIRHSDAFARAGFPDAAAWAVQRAVNSLQEDIAAEDAAE